MTDLLSLVVEVRALETVSMPTHLGRAVYAQFLRWLDAADPALASRWHDADGIKPYTCSSLVGGKRTDKDRRQITPEDPLWFRITALDSTVAQILLALAAQPPTHAELDSVRFAITAMHTDSNAHAWAGSTDYATLAAPYLLARQQSPRRLQMRLVTPVSFRQQGLIQPMPMPDLVFGGLADRWNAFSPLAVSPQLRDYCVTAVAIRQFELTSRSTPGKPQEVQIGATGEITYYAVTFDRYWCSVLGLLADYAFYAGVGRATATGMGQAHRIR